MTNRSTLQIAPRGTVSSAEHTTTPAGAARSSSSAPGVPEFGPAQWHAFQRATQPDYLGWLDHIRAASACTRPVRLSGWIEGAHSVTGHRLIHTDTAGMPDGVIYKACGNRRASVCPACARTYQRDAYQLLRAGLVGGKGVPQTVSQHPAVFVTMTAPSFGILHTRAVKRHTCTERRRCDCRAEPRRARTHGDAGLCPHGTASVCFARHEHGDERLGRPMCLDCYDHDHQVVWNLFAGELWRRTKQAAERWLAQLARRRGIPPVHVVSASGKRCPVPPVRVSHAKAAGFQVGGAVHFHALLRLGGADPADPAAVVPHRPGSAPSICTTPSPTPSPRSPTPPRPTPTGPTAGPSPGASSSTSDTSP